MSIIQGKEEIVRISKQFAKDMGIEEDKIAESDRVEEIFILATREYDKRQRESEKRINE